MTLHLRPRSARKRRFVCVGVGVAVALAVAVPTAFGVAAAKPKVVTNYLQYVGGKAGKANPKLSPIVIGWINQQGGQFELGPGATTGADVGVRAINELYGGIGGHRIVLKKCFIKSAEEEGTSCGQQMANDKRVSIIGMGAVAIGNQSLYSTIAGKKPIVFNVGPNALLDGKLPNGFILFGDTLSILGPFGTFAKQVLKAKTAAVIYPQQPGLATAADATAKGLRDAGITTKVVGYDPNQTDLVGPLTAAGAQSADVIATALDPPGCINVAKGLQQLGLQNKPVLSNPLCLNPAVAQGLGDLPKWYYAIASANTVDPGDPAVPPMLALLKRFGQIKVAPDPWVGISVSEIMTIAKWMNAVGAKKITPAALMKQAKAFRGPLAFGAPEVRCGKNPALPANCSDQSQWYQYLGAGKFKRAASWLKPPASK
jgi:branched-chain amino acid transport system substrate-binding protein